MLGARSTSLWQVMNRTVLVRYAAYPVIFGGVASFILTWSTLGQRPWPALPIAALIGIAFVAWLERLQPFETDWNRDHHDTATDIAHLLINLGMLSAAAFLLHAGRAWLPAPLIWPTAWPVWGQVLLAGAILDLGLYAMHRLSHRVDWLWRLHAIHHSAERLYWMNGERRHPLSALLLAAPGLSAAAILGAPPAVVSAWLALLSVHLAFQHANLDYSLGPLRRWIGGAELHRWHHKREFEDAQVNFGEFWLLWDRLFGSLHDETTRLPSDAVGLREPAFPQRYFAQLAWPFRR